MEVSDYKNPEFLERYKKTPLLHPFVVFPSLLDIFGDVENKKILDLGCGSGDFAQLLAERGADVVGVDISEKWIEICKKEHANAQNLNFFVADGSNLEQLADESFDFVVMNMVLLNVPTKEKVQQIFKEVSRVLKKSGELVFTDLNPLGLMIEKTTAETQTYLPGFSYFKDGSKFKSKVLLTDGSEIEFVDLHWTLETYTCCLSDAEMYLYRIIEPQPVKEAPAVLKDYGIPEHIILVCRKL
ncbi:MAG: class I SAM-dependent methyltransferase [Candidatus Altiarchaeales archaeon]|nr:class I SAM-dependent methyltransferase [Candidatus Altiarchaeota archaeon]MBU4342195.1 class I SAM-dependent methyltransferase [Candidatus Altiarchaeota archaeon]MBU4437380.1 class I SAM-dependent methyltransferase [Candidatus Altiarchaeota archaeon]MCG2783134.1 class I SAM-dependent methyltransferase [Candidatus Altiarchaeales archaeon]